MRRPYTAPRLSSCEIVQRGSEFIVGEISMRIVKGKFAGRHLMSPADKRVRPTREEVRDAMLTMLEPELKGARVLDLFAGTGALGLEAISRGAKYADFVEFRPGSLHALKANVAALRLLEKCRIFKKDAVPFTAALDEDRYDIAFADPPYESKVLDRILDMWKARPFARILIVEHASTHTVNGATRRERMGESVVSVFRKREERGEKREERGGKREERG